MSPIGSGFGENALVEQPAIGVFADIGWTTANLYYETYGVTARLGRETRREALLPARLLAALRKLNPELPDGALAAAVEQVRTAPLIEILSALRA